MTSSTSRDVAWVHDDGGRSAAGFRGVTGDCVTRSLAIATGRTYAEVYDAIIEYAKRERPRGNRKRSHPRTGVHNSTTRKIMSDWGWEWVPTMHVGSGTTVHLRADELPEGCLVVACSKHYTAVINGVIHDTYDPSRDGTRCVYGYYQLRNQEGTP